MADIAALTALIEPEARALGFDLVRVMLFGGGDDLTLQVMAERPDTRQLNIDDCALLSRRISDLLDELEVQGKDPIETAYRLEVSSPGIDRPLTRLKDYADWAGHEARIGLVEPAADGRKQYKGMIAGLDGETVLLDDPRSGRHEIEFSNIASAKLILTDALISATVPLSTEGADDIVTTETED
ncbi:MAG: ribosome maturation protein RimP [Sphingobium sp.]|nr:ribosome maturation protein RimP [Sphingobium sp.]